jgi:hypothetical protein
MALKELKKANNFNKVTFMVLQQITLTLNGVKNENSVIFK